jgi:hypothetical protein
MIIRNSKIPQAASWFFSVGAITLYPFVFVKGEGSEKMINHERIHLAQQKELWILGFYVLYLLDWALNLAKGMSKKEAYRNIIFEKEAYENDDNLAYLETRVKMGWRKYNSLDKTGVV